MSPGEEVLLNVIEQGVITDIQRVLKYYTEKCQLQSESLEDTEESRYFDTYWTKVLYPEGRQRMKFHQNILFSFVQTPHLSVLEIKACLLWFLGLKVEDCMSQSDVSDAQAIIEDVVGMPFRVGDAIDTTQYRSLTKASELDRNRQSILFYIVLKKDEIAKKLCEFVCHVLGVDASLKDNAGQSALFYAAREGNTETVKFFVENGVGINSVDNIKQTALFYASRDNRIETVVAMLKAGADPSIKDSYRKTATQYAAHHPHIVNLLRRSIQQLAVETNGQNGVKRQNKGKTIDKKRRRHALVVEGPSSVRWDEQRGIPVIFNSTSVEFPAGLNVSVEETTPLHLVPTLHDLEMLESAMPGVSLWSRDWPQWGAKVANTESFDQAENRRYACGLALTQFRTYWISEIKRLIDLLKTSKNIKWFMRPVDPVVDGCTDYLSVIKDPQDFGTLKKNLNEGRYVFVEEALSQANLIFSNCFTYNHEPTNAVHMSARQIQLDWTKMLKERHFPDLWVEVEKRLIECMDEMHNINNNMMDTNNHG